MKQSGILFLSHQGFSFIDDLIRVASRLGLESYVLSSRPGPHARGRQNHIKNTARWARVLRRPTLRQDDVTKAIADLKRSGMDVRACLSVWEGYRLLMARANAALGANDASESSLLRTLDKYRLRRTLCEAGLSRARTELASQSRLAALQRSSTPKFLKPRIGLGSFGAFRLSRGVTWGILRALQQEMASDYEYGPLFQDNGDFVLEDYIPGVEVSFEAFAIEGVVNVVAVHEKLKVTHSGRTTLEDISASPPVSIPEAALAAGRTLLQQSFSLLGITSGCFHVEAKWNPKTEHWEIIEINPRVGGALIKESVEAVTHGIDLLAVWMQLMLAVTPEERARIAKNLRQAVPPRGETATFFRVFFGQPGRTIERVWQNPVQPVPDLVRIAVKPGTALPRSSREIFLGQALWKRPRKTFPGEIENLKKISRNTLEVRYDARA